MYSLATVAVAGMYLLLFKTDAGLRIRAVTQNRGMAACLGVLAFDILYGVLVAIALSVADLLFRVARPHDAIQGIVPGLAGMHDVDDYPDAQAIPGLVVYRYDAPLCFANAEDFRRRALAAADGPPGPLRWFVLNVEANVEVDFTALEAMEALREDITNRGAVFALARVKQDLLARLEAFGLAGKIGAELLFPTLPTAVQAYQDGTKDPQAEKMATIQQILAAVRVVAAGGTAFPREAQGAIRSAMRVPTPRELEILRRACAITSMSPASRRISSRWMPSARARSRNTATSSGLLWVSI